MKWLNRARLRLSLIARRRQLDRDLEDELRFHLEMLGPDRAGAQRQFGNFTGLKEACREMWTLGSIETWLQDLRYSLRMLRRSLGFTAVAVLALALGIGVNTTVFSLVNGALYKNLPFTDSDRILYMLSAERTNGFLGDISYSEFQNLRGEMKSFDGVAATTRNSGDISDGIALPQSYHCSEITANSFSVIGQKPVAGRDFTTQDELPGSPRAALIAYSLWENRYGKDAAVIGRTIRINAVPTVVIGVMPRGLTFPADADLWIPLVHTGEDPRSPYVTVFGHLASGATMSGARAEASTIASRLAQQFPDTNRNRTFVVQTYNEMALGGRVRLVFWLMLASVGFVLLIACANVANLLLARAVGRSREVSIRVALGAGRLRVMRQLLMESLLLSMAGGILGWFLAMWGTRAFDLAVIPTGKPAWVDFSLDYRVLLYLTAISIGTGILFGMVPALRLSKADVGTALKEGGRGSGAGRRGRFLSGALVVTEMALAVVLLAGAGLMLRSFLTIYATPVGVNTAGVFAMRTELPAARYSHVEQQIDFYQRLKSRIETLPGVESVTVLSQLPGDGMLGWSYQLEGTPIEDTRLLPHGGLLIGPEYFRVMQVALLSGRSFTEADGVSGTPVVIVNQSMANRYWPHENPVGKRLRLVVNTKQPPQPWLTVVGVTPDILQNNNNLIEHDPLIYLPYRERPQARMFIAARTTVPAASLGDVLRQSVQAIDPDLPVRESGTLETQVARRSWLSAIFGVMFGIFGVIAFVLASVGLYAVMAHSVTQRTQEIGLRVAMGAKMADVLRLVFWQGMRQLAVGLAIGVPAALAVTRGMRGILAGVSPSDPLTYTGVTLLLTAAGILGCAIPARRAVRVDPAITLRYE